MQRTFPGSAYRIVFVKLRLCGGCEKTSGESGGGCRVSEPSHAVSLSYASQDAEVAQNICAALRAAGVEVFLDQSELRASSAGYERTAH